MTQNVFGVVAICGAASDTCLTFGDGGTRTWLWRSASLHCESTWHRLRTEADGGATCELSLDAGYPREWLDAAPLCWDER